MIAVLLASAQIQVATLAGIELVANDPFVSRRGPTLAVEIRPVPYLGFSVMGGVYPNFGQLDWTPLMTEILEENQIAPDISRIMSRQRAAAHWFPVNTELGELVSSVGLFVGGGLMHTRDDLEVLHEEETRRFVDSEKQAHGSFSWGLTAEVRRKSIGMRVRFEESRYQELVGRNKTEKKVPVWFGADLVIWQM